MPTPVNMKKGAAVKRRSSERKLDVPNEKGDKARISLFVENIEDESPNNGTKVSRYSRQKTSGLAYNSQDKPGGSVIHEASSERHITIRQSSK